MSSKEHVLICMLTLSLVWLEQFFCVLLRTIPLLYIYIYRERVRERERERERELKAIT
jgi:hypothetical protein